MVKNVFILKVNYLIGWWVLEPTYLVLLQSRD